MATLRQLRERARLTQEQLAARAGIVQTALSALECGKVVDPRLSTIERVAGGLRVSLPTAVRALRASNAAHAHAAE